MQPRKFFFSPRCFTFSTKYMPVGPVSLKEKKNICENEVLFLTHHIDSEAEASSAEKLPKLDHKPLQIRLATCM